MSLMILEKHVNKLYKWEVLFSVSIKKNCLENMKLLLLCEGGGILSFLSRILQLQKLNSYE